MPNNIPFVFPTTRSGDFPPTDINLLKGNQQQGFGFVSTMINPFFTQGFLNVGTAVGNFNYFFATASAQTALEVSDYNKFTFQAYASGSGATTITVTSTVDGINFNPEFTFTGTGGTATLYTLPSSSLDSTYRRRYFVATFSGSGNATGSLYMLGGQ
jgi:hypothetical protein